ncbi:MAG TPA: cofactor assembly of complex C subunit B [Cyanobacteria bacterium UBA11049]|nr:cofactor assembly of complex C subunit B [Cyanobacteria bacterium UBA11049]
MNSTILSSTLLLTLLLCVGLFFFIRASTKDRTQQVKFVSDSSETSLMTQLQQYMQQRSYQVTRVDAENNSVTFEGFVRPSVFLAIFLSILAAVGFLCLALVWSTLFPSWSQVFLGLVFLSPAAGLFYWKKAARNEQVSLKLENTSSEQQQSQVTAIGHRDELIELARSLKLKSAE